MTASGVSQPPEPEMPVEDHLRPSRRPGDAVSVLLVEDNLGDARLVEEHLASGYGPGHEMTHCKRLSDAIAWLDEHHCDLVLLDLSLPDSRGLATLQQLLGHAFGVPVVVLTGADDEAQAYQAIQSGAQDYLHKDAIDPLRLARTVRYAIERKQWEDSVLTNDEHLHRLEKSEAIARLCEGLAHNFNNILTAILGNCELLLARIAQDDKATRYAENIQEAARQAADQTRELKSFCRERKAQPQRVDLARFLRGLAPLLAGAASRRIDLNVESDADDAWALADPGELEQVVLNLVQNAQAAVATVAPTADGGQGEVRVRVRRIDLASAEVGHPDTVPAGSYAVIEVVDDGPGVASDIVPRIFDSFFTTKGGKSVGLGLTTSLALV
ncbi:MAG: response regulator, partial [Planctomycetes bacterium]|nr:response regulator [Planctomycetota bacterium]